MKITCLVLKINKLSSDFIELTLQPLLEDSLPFLYPIHNPTREYHIGEYLAIDVASIINLYAGLIEFTAETIEKEELK